MTDDEKLMLLEMRESQDHGAFAVACDGKKRREVANRLERNGWASWRGTNWGSSFYAITDAGHAAIAALIEPTGAPNVR